MKRGLEKGLGLAPIEQILEVPSSGKTKGSLRVFVGVIESQKTSIDFNFWRKNKGCVE